MKKNIWQIITSGLCVVLLVVVVVQGKKIDEIQTSISNDGSRLYRENATVIWKDREVDITLHGCEQEDETYTMAY